MNVNIHYCITIRLIIKKQLNQPDVDADHDNTAPGDILSLSPFNDMAK